MARPRSEEARRKVLDAATDIIVERGVGGLTIEEVAARSGVAKTTIYRHWPERTVAHPRHRPGDRSSTSPRPTSARCAADLIAFFGGIVRADLSGKVGRLMPCLIDAASRDPEMELLLERLAAEREQPIMTIVARAQERGELPADLDPQVVIGSIVGPIVFRKVMQRRPVDAAYLVGVPRRGDHRALGHRADPCRGDRARDGARPASERLARGRSGSLSDGDTSSPRMKGILHGHPLQRHADDRPRRRQRRPHRRLRRSRGARSTSRRTCRTSTPWRVLGDDTGQDGDNGPVGDDPIPLGLVPIPLGGISYDGQPTTHRTQVVHDRLDQPQRGPRTTTRSVPS